MQNILQEARRVPEDWELWSGQYFDNISAILPVLTTLGGVVAVAEILQLIALNLEHTSSPSFTLYAPQTKREQTIFQPSPPTSQLPSATSELTPLLLRYPNIDCPNCVLVNQKFSLFVQLLIKSSEEGAEAIEVKDTGVEQLPEVEVVLRTHNFDIVDSNTKVLQVERNDDSEERFVLIPRCLGEEQIRIDFYQYGRRIGTWYSTTQPDGNGGEASKH